MPGWPRGMVVWHECMTCLQHKGSTFDCLPWDSICADSAPDPTNDLDTIGLISEIAQKHDHPSIFYLNIFLIDMGGATFMSWFFRGLIAQRKKMYNAGGYFLKRMQHNQHARLSCTVKCHKKIVMLCFTDDLGPNRGFKLIISIKAMSRVVTLKYWIRNRQHALKWRPI